MIHAGPRRALFFVAWLTMMSVPAWPQEGLDKLKSEYKAVSSQLQKRVVFDSWIDSDSESPKLLARQWSLAGEWVAAWLDSHPAEGPEGLKTALGELVPDEIEPEYLKLNENAFLVVAPSPIGNVFIVAKSDGHYHLAWNAAQPQEARGEQAVILAAWRPENARHGGRGPYFAASGSTGSVLPRLGKLPNDVHGHPRFYIDGTYAQSAGGTVGAQISVWVWDGITARPQIARAYALMVDQSVGTRVEGDLLKVQQKKLFRTFFSCGMCEERQTDWNVRLIPEGVQDLGEESLVPELDAVDELFYRVIHHKSAADVAAPCVIKSAERIVGEVRAKKSVKDWKEFPTLGMMGTWKIKDNTNNKTLCLSLDDAGTNLFTLKSTDGNLHIADLKETKQSCEEWITRAKQ